MYLTLKSFDTACRMCEKPLPQQGIQSLNFVADLQKCNETLSLNTVTRREALTWCTSTWRKKMVVIQLRNVEINEIYCSHYSGFFLEVVAVIILYAWKLKM